MARFHSRTLRVDVEVAPAVSLSLARCRHALPRALLAPIEVCSPSGTRQARRLTVSVGPYLEANARVPALAADTPQPLTPNLSTGDEALASLDAPTRCPVTVAVNGTPLTPADDGPPPEPWVLAYDQWSALTADHWPTLAAFVQHEHPLVKEIAEEIVRRVGPHARPEDQLAALYAHLRDDWQLEYLLEPPNDVTLSEPGGLPQFIQRVRLPDWVLLDRDGRRGGGTCLDLALLFAACLEHLHAEPLVAILALRDPETHAPVRHALVGCWATGLSGLLPVYSTTQQRDALLRYDRAVWVDATGIVRDARYRQDIATATASAVEDLRTRQFLFALDVRFAHRHGFLPLPSRGEPVPEARVGAAMRAAADCASTAKTQLSTVPLLIGLLSNKDSLTARVFAACLVDVPRAVQRMTCNLRPDAPSGPNLSQNYEDAIALARSRAKREQSAQVLEQHLLSGLLDVRSGALTNALRDIGTDRETVRARLDAMRSGHPAPTQGSVYGRADSPGA